MSFESALANCQISNASKRATFTSKYFNQFENPQIPQKIYNKSVSSKQENHLELPLNNLELPWTILNNLWTILNNLEPF